MNQTPGQRAAWHEAFAAIGPAGGSDVRALPDGLLWLLRDTYLDQPRRGISRLRPHGSMRSAAARPQITPSAEILQFSGRHRL